ncbi:MAG TPA: hypothetical protein VGC32_02780 [Solirubrobacterales bacterium]
MSSREVIRRRSQEGAKSPGIAQLRSDVTSTAVPVEVLPRRAGSTAEAYVEGLRTRGEITEVSLLLDHGLPAQATIPTVDVESRGLREGEIVFVRLEPSLSVE